jgi:hypothetical protein
LTHATGFALEGQRLIGWMKQTFNRREKKYHINKVLNVALGRNRRGHSFKAD